MVFGGISIPAAAISDNLVSAAASDFETSAVPSEWKCPYGGSLSISSERSYTGNKSLKFTGRSQTWHSPALNIYDMVKANGPGRYEISLYVAANAIPDQSYIGGRLIVRGTKANSFIKLNPDGNYYANVSGFVIVSSNLFYQYKGYIDVSAGDIADTTGTFNVILDTLPVVEGQVLYIDNVSIRYYEDSYETLPVTPASRNIVVGEEAYIYTSTTPVSFYSSNPNVAAVDYNGKITGISPGTATITAYSGNAAGYCQVTVSLPNSPTPGIISGNSYYVKNRTTNLYVHTLQDNSVAANKFYSHYSQRYTFVYEGNGKYKIHQKDQSNKIFSGTSMNFNSSDRWYVVRQFDNSYKLIKCNSQSEYSSVGVQNATPGTALTMQRVTAADNNKWYLKNESVNVTGTQYFGASSTRYGTESILGVETKNCDYGYRGSATLCADAFLQAVSAGYEGLPNNRTILFNRKDSEATKHDFMSKSIYYISKDNIDDVDFMLFVGHGVDAKMHFDYGPNGEQHKDNILEHNLPEFMFDDARFGYGSARTKWVCAYTCNYLTGSDEELKTRMQGANIVMGYATRSYLNTPQMEDFGKRLREGETIIDAYFKSGRQHSNFGNNPALLRVMYVEEAEFDTIYNYYPNAGTYETERILFKEYYVEGKKG